MKTTKRFTEAVTKLYNAFHEGKLDAFDCAACAVGNILNNDNSWGIGEWRITGERNFTQKQLNCAGYNLEELNNVELLFMYGTTDKQNTRHRHNFLKPDIDVQFKGLCAVVEYLCELDGIPNVMDYTCLFETESDKPKYELSF